MAQQPSVIVYGGAPPGSYQPTVVQTVSQTAVPVPVRRNDILPHRESHKRIGIIQMIVGSLCILFSVIGFIEGGGGYYSFFGSGIYSGIFFIIPGVLGYIAYEQNSKCYVIACMVMNIIGSCVAIIGLSFASIELSVNTYKTTEFQKAKCGIIIFCCIFEFVITIVHAGFTCASCCDCCLPRETVAIPGQLTAPIVVQSIPQTNIAYPTQTYQYQHYMPQHQAVVQQPNQQAPPLTGYPDQFNYMQNTPDAPPPYNPESYNQPPPYSDMPSSK